MAKRLATILHISCIAFSGACLPSSAKGLKITPLPATVANLVNTVDREAPRCRAKPIVLVDLMQESKAKEERERKRAGGPHI